MASVTLSVVYDASFSPPEQREYGDEEILHGIKQCLGDISRGLPGLVSPPTSSFQQRLVFRKSIDDVQATWPAISALESLDVTPSWDREPTVSIKGSPSPGIPGSGGSLTFSDPGFSVTLTFVEQQVSCPIPQVRVMGEVLAQSTDLVVRRAIEDQIAFQPDRPPALAGLSARYDPADETIVFCSTLTTGHPARAAIALLKQTRTPNRVATAPRGEPTTPVLVAGITALTLALSIGLAFVETTAGSLAALILEAIGALAIGWYAGHRLPWATARGVSIGLLPVAILLVFAAVYGAFALGSPGAITHDHRTPDALGDLLLLSLNVMATGGIPDLTLTGVIRDVVYIQMLLFIGVAGASVAYFARWGLDRLVGRFAPTPE